MQVEESFGTIKMDQSTKIILDKVMLDMSMQMSLE